MVKPALRVVRGGSATAGPPSEKCELCGRRRLLIPTECCKRLVCGIAGPDGREKLTIGGCYRKHQRYSLCTHHFAEGHAGEWQTCAECRGDFGTEIYVWYGTNEHNFEKLENPPAFEPTLCAGCGKRIKLGTDAYQRSPDGSHRCDECWDES
jgi:hypothetical protein